VVSEEFLKELRDQKQLLDRTPKGIEKLTMLEVIKGFVIGEYSKTLIVT